MIRKPLWAPWRMEYIANEKPEGCIFCHLPKGEDDKKDKILYRGETSYVVLNIYPYSVGHMMVVPFRHVSEYDELMSDELEESAMLTQKSIKALKGAFASDGFNIGVNQGKVAGAGIEEHLHIHVVPRWTGDLNFMPVIGQTSVLPAHLSETFDSLRKFF